MVLRAAVYEYAAAPALAREYGPGPDFRLVLRAPLAGPVAQA
jgi:hypothetical protein